MTLPATDLPSELQESILSLCTPSALASLSRTDKANHHQAMRMLYDTISLHDSRWEQLSDCILALASFPSVASLVHTLVVTVTEGEGSGLPLEHPKKHFAALMLYLDLALSHTSSLKVLSVWAPEEYGVTKIELAVRRGNFNLTRLYISGLEDFPKLMASQPDLQAVCIWNESTWGKNFDGEAHDEDSDSDSDGDGDDFPLYISFVQYKRALSTADSEAKPSPVFFGILHHDAPGVINVREVNLFDYPSKQGPVDRLPGVPDIQVTARPFWHINADNSVVHRVLQQDLRRERPPGAKQEDPPVDDWLFFVLPDFSCGSIVKAARLLELCITENFRYSKTIPVNLRLHIVQPSGFPQDMPSIISAFQDLFRTCAIQGFVSQISIKIAFGPDDVFAGYPKCQEMAEILLGAAATCGSDRGGIEHFEFSDIHYRLRHRNEGFRERGELTWHRHGTI